MRVQEICVLLLPLNLNKCAFSKFVLFSIKSRHVKTKKRGGGGWVERTNVKCNHIFQWFYTIHKT